MTCRNLSARLPIRYLGIERRDAKFPIKWFHSQPPLPRRPYPPLFLFLSRALSRTREVFSCPPQLEEPRSGRHQSNTIDSSVICFPENTASPSGPRATPAFVHPRTVPRLTSVDPRGRPRTLACVLEPTYLHGTTTTTTRARARSSSFVLALLVRRPPPRLPRLLRLPSLLVRGMADW